MGQGTEVRTDRKGSFSAGEGKGGYTLWLEGLPGSGKSTLGGLLASVLKGAGKPVESLDGDEVRKGLSPDLGFTRKDREVHAHRVGYVSHLLSQQGVRVIVSLITPYESSRNDVRAQLGDRMIEVWVRCPLEVCEARDPKGLYRKAREGIVKSMTGIDDPFEEPRSPDVIVDTNKLSKDECVGLILSEAKKRGFY